MNSDLLWVSEAFCLSGVYVSIVYGYESPLIGNNLFSLCIKILGGAKVVRSLIHISLVWATEKQRQAFALVQIYLVPL